MEPIVDRVKARIGQLKADRSTEQGVAGHQAAMKALGTQMGYASPVVSSNVSIIPDELFGKKRVKSLSKPGSHTYSNKEENKTNKGHR